YNPRYVRASQRLARARGRFTRRSRFYARGNFISPALSTSREQFSFALRVHEFWYDGRRRGGSKSVRSRMGTGSRTKAVQAARHDFDQLPLRGFYRAQEQGIGACADRWQMGAKVQTRSRCAIAEGWGEFFG